MARDLIDDRLVGALHLRALDRSGFDHDRAGEHTAFQIGTLDALMAGHYDGDTTIGELLTHGDLGIGTIEQLGGELIVLDGEPFVVDGDGTVEQVAPSTTTPFAVLCRFAPLAAARLDGPLGLAEVHRRLDAMAPGPLSVLAVRVDGTFRDLRLRSVHRQHAPYPPLAEVTARQREWTVERATGSIVGFRFPDAAAGVEVPGFHLHFLSSDRRCGGHILDLVVEQGHAAVDGGDELHVELPAGVEIGVPGTADRAAIADVEGGTQ